MKKEETSVILQLEAPQKRGYAAKSQGNCSKEGLGVLRERHDCSHLMRKDWRGR